MLMPFNYFLMHQAIKSPIYLTSPNVIPHAEINLPKLSILHYLDSSYGNHFPDRNLDYFSKIPKIKKIPIYHIVDLVSKEEIANLANKSLQQEIRKWSQSNVKNFKSTNLLEFPNSDVNTVAVFNYNLLTDLYKYKASLISSYHQYQNLYLTYWSTIKAAVSKDSDTYHFIKIDVPNIIPNYNIINVILKFNPIKYTRMVKDSNLSQIIDIYKWLINSTRNSSTLKDITDEDSNRIIIEFSYKGYSSFLPLYIIRSICNESKLDNNVKVSDGNVQKLFILSLYKMQDKINSILELESSSNLNIHNNTPEENLSEFKKEDDDEYAEDELSDNFDYKDVYGISAKSNISHAAVTKVNLNKLNKDTDININKSLDNDVNSITQILDNEIKYLDENKEKDIFFEESVIQINESSDTVNTIVVNNSEEHVNKVLADKTLEDKFNIYVKEVSEFKLLTAQELRTLRKTYEERKSLPSPYEKNTNIDVYKKLTPEDTILTKEETNLNINNDLIPDNLKNETLASQDQKYINNVLHKDIIGCVTNLEKSGIIIKDYTVEKSETILGNYEIHRLSIKPLHGKESTVYFRLPKIDSDGEAVITGIKVRMRRQRTDYPIRKISPTRVSITSNYGKLFIFRTERKTNDDFSYITNYIKNSYINEDGLIKKIKPGNNYSNLIKLPNVYSNLSMSFETVTTENYTFHFNYKKATDLVDEKTLKDILSKKLVFIGYNSSKDILVTDYSDAIYNYTKSMEPLGDIIDLLNLDRDKVPKPFTVINVLGDALPLGVAVSYYTGISNLIAITNSKYELIEADKKFTKTARQIVLKFKDYKLILEPSKKEDFLLFHGFLFFKEFIKNYDLKDFDFKDIYLSLLEFRGLSLLHLKELNLLEELFLDPVTVDVLASIKEPTDYLRLLLRANEMLNNFSHPDINDPNYSRIRGYDRIPGLMYKALAESIRAYKFKGTSRSKIELDPYKVWNAVTRDNTVKITEDNNPITDLKEIESVTLSGADGLNKDATPLLLRRYHKNDIGFISEATVDSGDVALNTYLTPYARFKNIRGLIDVENKDHVENKAKCFSTSTMLAVGSDQDD